MLQEKEPDEEFIKEVYAWFGLAYYHSECLHRELCNIYALSNFRNKSEMTTPRVEEKLAYAYKLTLGQIRDELKNIIPNDLFLKLNDGVEKRNYLAHHFFTEQGYMIKSKPLLIQLR